MTDETCETAMIAVQGPNARKVLQPLIGDIDQRLDKIEGERSALLSLRHAAMKEVGRAISGIPITWDEKRILYQLIDEHEKSSRDTPAHKDSIEMLLRDVKADVDRNK